ncbi:MAG: N-acetylglucosamine kinase, partial [Brachybacterium sp.]|nr:N-acetylglucosamine kinase [Brachybacterium sp.]
MVDAAATGGADSPAPPLLVIAGDIGGTSSRLVLAPLDGAVIAEAEGPGANLRSSGAQAFDHVAATTREVLERGRVALGGRG